MHSKYPIFTTTVNYGLFGKKYEITSLHFTQSYALYKIVMTSKNVEFFF